MIDRVAGFPARLARSRRFTAGVPTAITPSSDGTTVHFLRDRNLYRLTVATGRERRLARDVDAFDGPALIRDGELWIRDGGLRRHPAPGRVRRVRSDRSGRRFAYVVDDAVRVLDDDGDRPLGPPADDLIWSPEGTALLITLVDESAVPHRRPDGRVVPPAALSAATGEEAAGRPVPYPVPGEVNPRITLVVAGPAGRWVETVVAEYLVRAGWDAHGPFAVVLTRDQRTLRLLAIDPESGATETVFEQRGEPWVHVVPGLPARRADQTVVAHVDLGDTRHLTVGGVPVTPAGLQVREVLSVEPSVLFTASLEPAVTQLWSYRNGSWRGAEGDGSWRGAEGDGSWRGAEGDGWRRGAEGGGSRRVAEGGGLRWMAEGDGLRRVAAGGGLRRVADEPGTVRDGQFVHCATPGRVTVVREGQPSIPVRSAGETGQLPAYRKSLKRASLFLPSWHRPGVGLPVLLDPYGGPTRQRVTAVGDWRDQLSQWFAEQGFAVLVADGAGTPGAGPRDERRIHGDLYTEPVADQIAALEAAASVCPDLDLERVGIRGWSFGGSLALAALLSRPDVFRAAVAGAAVTDQRLFHAESRERYLGDPARFPERYDAGDLAARADRLTRPLLLMHGLADTTVLPVHSTRLADALRAAGRPVEVRFLPGVGHSAIGSPATPEILAAQLDFLRRHLREAGPR